MGGRGHTPETDNKKMVFEPMISTNQILSDDGIQQEEHGGVTALLDSIFVNHLRNILQSSP